MIYSNVTYCSAVKFRLAAFLFCSEIFFYAASKD